VALHKAWEDIPREELSRKIKRRIVTGEKVMTAIVDLAEGAVVPLHQHDSEQITYVVSGWLRFTMGDGSVIDVKSGETLVIPSNVEHAAVAMEDTVDMDCFSPIREDWLTGDDAYLRGDDED
jgi:quercetin dioxygenase-like cupin family protein